MINRIGWMYVGAAFQRGSRHCDDCDYQSHTQEPRPYGEGVVYEEMTECTLGNRSGDSPTSCPAYVAYLNELMENEEMTPLGDPNSPRSMT